jgi:potassium-transporting ATPase KdpC subunit
VKKDLQTGFFIFLVLTLITGFLYPLVVTGIAGLVFPEKAGGSLITRKGEAVGSALIGQPFDDPNYFWGRPSATGPYPYHGTASSGSNWAEGNPALLEAVRQRVTALRTADPGNTQPVPVDLVTASGSGLDPQISPAAAAYQVPRVARERGIAETRIRALVGAHTKERQLGIFGEPRVNVLELNLSLDTLRKE